jgi:predicted nuclease of predicted toxin-antitoxin system
MRLEAAGHDAAHVRDSGIADASDDVVMAAAAKDRRVLITRNGDFTRMLARSRGSGPSILLLRSTTKERPEELADWIIAALRDHRTALIEGAIVVLLDDGTRVANLPIKDK